MNKKTALFLTIGTGLALAAGWLLAISGFGIRGVRASGFTVCPAGPPACDYSVIQDAVDAAGDGDVIKVAAGTYDHINNRYGHPQILYLDKSITIKGGYTTDFTELPDPVANPTTLDAGGQGRVIFIEGTISPTIEGLRITGGEAKDLGSPIGIDTGGGVMVISATATLKDNYIFENSADSTHNGDGGGMFLYHSDATLEDNTISQNTVQRHGGGVYLLGSSATLKGNTISDNTAASGGGGVMLESSDALLTSNTILSNTTTAGWGGGVGVHLSAATLSGNSIYTNTAESGGGVVVYESDHVTILGNTIAGNTASDTGGGVAIDQSSNIVLTGNSISTNQANGYGGGGLFFYLCDQVTIKNNNITANHTPGDAGGLMPGAGDFSIIGNNFISNTAGGAGGAIAIHDADGQKIIEGNTFAGNTAGSEGGGLHLNGNPVLTNNLIVENQAAIFGSGVNVSAGTARLIHNTIARNTGGEGWGIYMGGGTTAYITNTLLVTQTVGIYLEFGSSASLESTLWGNGVWTNGLDWDGAGAINHTNDHWGNPDFVDYLAGDYHIGENSAAIDAGIDAGVTSDIDNLLRPYQLPDIGADEYWPPGALKFLYLPIVIK